MRKDKIQYQFEEAVKQGAERFHMLVPGDRVVAALSGGADSVSLLLALQSLARDGKFSVAACHVNHGIRKEGALRDEVFCRNLCRELSIPLFVERVDIPHILQENPGSVEELARRERYRVLEELCRREGFTKIATAHTLSDNAETVLLNLCRGTSPDGLCGIPPVRGRVIRPLYQVSRRQVEEYLAVQGQDFVTDETNFETDYDRNFIRQEILPRLKQRLNPSLEETLRRMCDGAMEDRSYLEAALPPEDSLPASGIAELPPALRQRYVLRMCRKASEARVTRRQVEAVCRLLFLPEGKTVCLPGSCFAVIQNDRLTILKKMPQPEKTVSSGFHIALNLGQTILDDSFAVYLSVSSPEKTELLPDVLKIENNVYKLYEKINCRYDIIVSSLYARNRLPEDKIRIGGMGRLLKKVFADYPIPPELRMKIPVVCDDKGILCVPLFSAPRDGACAEGEDTSLTVAFYAAESFDLRQGVVK